MEDLEKLKNVVTEIATILVIIIVLGVLVNIFVFYDIYIERLPYTNESFLMFLVSNNTYRPFISNILIFVFTNLPVLILLLLILSRLKKSALKLKLKMQHPDQDEVMLTYNKSVYYDFNDVFKLVRYILNFLLVCCSFRIIYYMYISFFGNGRYYYNVPSEMSGVMNFFMNAVVIYFIIHIICVYKYTSPNKKNNINYYDRPSKKIGVEVIFSLILLLSLILFLVFSIFENINYLTNFHVGSDSEYLKYLMRLSLVDFIYIIISNIYDTSLILLMFVGPAYKVYSVLSSPKNPKRNKERFIVFKNEQIVNIFLVINYIIAIVSLVLMLSYNLHYTMSQFTVYLMIGLLFVLFIITVRKILVSIN